MTVPTGIERKVRQLDNDVQSIYEMLAEISGTQRRQGNRLDEIDGRLTSMDGRLASVEGRLASVEGKVTSVEGKVDAVLELLRDRPQSRA